jgi:hypothetical protein
MGRTRKGEVPMQTRTKLLTVFALSILMLGAPPRLFADSGDGSIYEVVKASENRIWRLNRQTGEVSVCTLEAERLICASSEGAATPPPQTYAEVQAERDRLAQLDASQREEDRKRKLAMLNLMMQTFKGLAESSTEASSTPDSGTGTLRSGD